jgi:hypothetical protein
MEINRPYLAVDAEGCTVYTSNTNTCSLFEEVGMNDYYIEELIKMLNALPHKTIKRIFFYIQRLYDQEKDG